MRTAALALILADVINSAAIAVEPPQTPSELYPALQAYLKARVTEFEQIPAERKAQLKKIALYVQRQRQANEPARLTFICTHNSRRSHISQIWAAAAASFYGIDGVETYSGGTEATAFNPRAISALQRAGMTITKVDEAGKTIDAKNPRYAVRFRDTDQPLIGVSKVYHEDPNPKLGFCAVMTCSQADASCPVVKGCSLRVALPFEDPKVADNQPDEEATYDERCQQICREMAYLFSQLHH